MGKIGKTGTGQSADFLNAKKDIAFEHVVNKGAANGYASLDGAGKVPTAQIPAGPSSPNPAADNNGEALGTDALRWTRLRAVSIVSGDIGFDDDDCANCGKIFQQGEEVILRVRKIERIKNERPITLCVPVHAKCKG